MHLLLVLAVLSQADGEATAPEPAADVPKGLSADECVKLAIEGSPKVDEAEARLKQWQARLAEVESIYYPKLIGLGFLAPMFTVEGDIFHVERRWQNIRDWGPYTYLEAVLAQPLYTFGRQEAGEDAARARAEVERARVREAENVLALEVKKLYFGHLLAKSLIKPLQSASDTAGKALSKAEELYEEGTGEVTQTDLEKLKYAKAEVQKYVIIAVEMADLAKSALKHTMGLVDTAPLELADETLPKLPESPEPELAPLLAKAAEARPEWAQLMHGKQAALKLEEAEALANAPVLALAGQFKGSWTPTRTNTTNPYRYDPYNDISGGVALALQFNIDPALASARAEGARAIGEEVSALERFASTGIPLQVKKAHGEVLRFRKLTDLGQDGVVAARKWMTFAAAAYVSGTGEARDVLEGLVAYLQARRGHAEAMYSYYIAQAELAYAVGSR